MSCWCGEVATLRCSACSGRGSTGVYCCPDHQKIYYRFHKTQCKSDRMTSDTRDTIIIVLPLDDIENKIRSEYSARRGGMPESEIAKKFSPSIDPSYWNSITVQGNITLTEGSPPEEQNQIFGQIRTLLIASATAENFKLLSTSKTFPFYYITVLDRAREKKHYILPFIKEFFNLGCMLNISPKNKTIFKSIKLCVTRLQQMVEFFINLEGGVKGDASIQCCIDALDSARTIEAAYGAFLRYEITEEGLMRRNIELIESICLKE